jgi:hypothetical protein
MKTTSRALFCAWMLTLCHSASAQVPVAASYPNEAWKVTRDWEERSPEAGLAWAANSGLNWQEKYSRWVQSLKKVPRHGESGFTFEITTPYGKTLPAPVIDCADTAMLLRVTFASWYGLPVLIKAGANYYGHFGIRKGSATAASSYLCASCDYSSRTAAELAAKGWPKDAALRAKGVGSGDANPAIGGGRTGTYLDELFLNKRVGHLINQLLNDAGSGNLAGSTNLYDIKAPAIKAGDVLIERWQATGIGHTIVIKSVDPAPAGKLRVEIAAGWLPPRQPLWEGSVDAHGALSDDYMGGSACVDSACKQTYAHFGGGIKRWRPPKKSGGAWVLSVMDADKASVFIDGKNYAELGKRPDQFEDLVYLPPPEELRDELLRLVNENRDKLRGKPSGCAARERREGFFQGLYSVMRNEFNKSREETDKLYRKTEDYVFAPLDYTKSSTCCWNSSTAQMGASVVTTAIATAKQKAAANACQAPLVFKKIAGDYATYRKAAEGAGVSWKPYSNDERCSQGSIPDDAEAPWAVTPYCTARPWLRE